MYKQKKTFLVSKVERKSYLVRPNFSFSVSLQKVRKSKQIGKL